MTNLLSWHCINLLISFFIFVFKNIFFRAESRQITFSSVLDSNSRRAFWAISSPCLVTYQCYSNASGFVVLDKVLVLVIGVSFCSFVSIVNTVFILSHYLKL